MTRDKSVNFERMNPDRLLTVIHQRFISLFEIIIVCDNIIAVILFMSCCACVWYNMIVCVCVYLVNRDVLRF